MHADSYFAIGKTHRVCQDYARVVDDRAFVSDGCSTTPDSDISARLLIGSIMGWPPRKLQECESHILVSAAAELAAKAARVSGYDVACLDATLLALFMVEENLAKDIRAVVAGDGVIAARHKDGTIETVVVEFPSGAPAYPSYALSDSRLQHYLEKFGGECKVTRTFGQDGIDTSTTKVRNWQTLALTWDFPVEDCDFVAIFSDGVQSFQREVSPKKFEPVPLHEVLQQVMAVKGGAGEFVTRRCQKFLKGFCAEHKWHHNDDFSMAAIWCGSEP